MSDESVSPTVLLLRTSLSAQSGCVPRKRRHIALVLYGLRQSVSHLMYCLFSNGIFILLEMKDQAFCAFSDNCVGLLLSFPEVYEIFGVFTLETDSDVREDCRSKPITNIEPFCHILVVEKCNCANVGYRGLLLKLILCIPCIVLVCVCVCVCVSSYIQISLCGKVLNTHYLPTQDTSVHDTRT